MIVIDASAMVALLFREVGHARVAEVLTSSECCMSTVNLSEVLALLIRKGQSTLRTLSRLRSAPLELIEFDAEQAALAAELMPRTKHLGLSLGDRACLALATYVGGSVLTADAIWAEADLEFDIEVIRTH